MSIFIHKRKYVTLFHMDNINDIHDTNRKWWDVTSPDWKQRDEETWRKCKEYSSFTLDSHLRPFVPIPSKQPGWVLGFQIPARIKLTPQSRSPLAVSSICSSDSTLQGPAARKKFLIVNPHSVKGIVFKLIFFLQ